MALSLAPEAPLSDWLREFDTLLDRSPGFFAGRSVVVDATGLPEGQAGLPGLIADLQARNVRILGIEGVDPGTDTRGLPPIIGGGRPVGNVELPPEAEAASPPAPVLAPPPPRAPSMLIDRPIRSGQSVYFPEGDVTVIGSLASGAEIIAGGSIHIYGTLRGRALAGMGHPDSRIFCRSLEAELLAIDGLYKVADDIDPNLRGRAVQASLTGETFTITAFD